MKKYLIVFCCFVLTPIMALGARCDENSDYVEPEYALCSTHAYNVGAKDNPTDSTMRAEIDEVVRLKSTLIAQEMKRQYDLLEVTMRQFRVQLQKAVLFPGDNTGGASSGPLSSNYGTSASSGGSADAGLADAQDCSGKQPLETVQCVYSNMSVISAASDNGKRISAAVQGQINIYLGLVNNLERGSVKIKPDCPSRLTNSNLAKCIQEMRSQTGNYITASASSNRNFNYGE